MADAPVGEDGDEEVGGQRAAKDNEEEGKNNEGDANVAKMEEVIIEGDQIGGEADDNEEQGRFAGVTREPKHDIVNASEMIH